MPVGKAEAAHSLLVARGARRWCHARPCAARRPGGVRRRAAGPAARRTEPRQRSVPDDRRRHLPRPAARGGSGGALARVVTTLRRALEWSPRSPRGLVWNDPARPHSPYGFTDTVGKTGELFFESLLYWTACRRFARLEAAGRNLRRTGVPADGRRPSSGEWKRGGTPTEARFWPPRTTAGNSMCGATPTPSGWSFPWAGAEARSWIGSPRVAENSCGTARSGTCRGEDTGTGSWPRWNGSVIRTGRTGRPLRVG